MPPGEQKKMIFFGKHKIEAWYSAPYPQVSSHDRNNEGFSFVLSASKRDPLAQSDVHLPLRPRSTPDCKTSTCVSSVSST